MQKPAAKLGTAVSPQIRHCEKEKRIKIRLRE